MDSNIIYKYIIRLKECSFLRDFKIEYDSEVFEKAINTFEYDFKRWYNESFSLERLSITPQLQTVLLYRIAHYIYDKHTNNHLLTNIFPPPPRTVNQEDVLSLLGREVGLIEIYYSSYIGPGLCVVHGGGSVIGARVKIGKNFTIHQNCTLGDRHGGRPTIGDNVKMYAGSMVLGDVTIGDNSIIGANSLVIDSFPANSILVGSPARNINI